MRTEEINIRPWAAYALGELGDGAAVDPLLEALKDGENPVLQKRAAEALGKLGNLRAVLGLCTTLKNKVIGVRLKSAAALSSLRKKNEL